MWPDRGFRSPTLQAWRDSPTRSSRGPRPVCFFFPSRRRHTILVSDWSSDVCSSDLFYDASVPTLIRSEAFRPSHNDHTGLSVFRAAFVQPVDTLANIEAGKRNEYHVARVAVQELRRLGLTVVPEPDPDGPLGQAVIPELSWQAYHADKQRLKQAQFELAKLASAAIVHQPS